jgi:glycine hydroxymethyltransferase
MGETDGTPENELLAVLTCHAKWREDCLNLVSAENRMSPAVRSVLGSDLSQRYGDYAGRNLNNRKYFGTRHIIEIESIVQQLTQDVFHTAYVELRAISGHMAGNTVLMALCKPGDLVIELSRHDGGHRLATKLAQSPLINLQVDYFPFNPEDFNIDVDCTLEMVRQTRPRMLIVGASNFLFPVQLQKLSVGLAEYPETILVYDASHVLGLIAGGEFQKPLAEGAHLVMGGTQKSFPGPQGALIYSNREDLMDLIGNTVYPVLESNHHLARIPALGLALIEMKNWGKEYARQVIANAQALAQALVTDGVNVVGEKHGYTKSHTILVNTAGMKKNNESLGQDLDDCGIICSATHLPQIMGGEGLRFGTNEITRLGATEEDMPYIARLIADVMLAKRSKLALRKNVIELAGKFSNVHYTWQHEIGI